MNQWSWARFPLSSQRVTDNNPGGRKKIRKAVYLENVFDNVVGEEIFFSLGLEASEL